jgi:malonyl CoA-acyl carrier protein transacylase
MPPHKGDQSEAESKSKSKEQAQPPKKTSAARLDFDLVCESIHKNTNQEPSPKTVQKILTMCEKADLDPVGVVELAEKPLLNPVAWVQAACRDPDGWLDRIGGWGKFQDRLNHSRDGPVKLDSTGPEDMAGIIQRAISEVR